MPPDEARPIEEIIKRAKAYYCIDCGKCTGNCPISRYDPSYSPRKNVEKALQDRESEFVTDRGVWQCLTCGMCETRCPSAVNYIQYMAELRREVRGDGARPVCSHGGTLQSLMRIMTAPQLKQNRLDWIPSDCKTSEDSDVLYFVGCLPYFDAYFTEIMPETLKIAQDTLRVLNAIGIEPNILPDERCCGHDLYWAGETDAFRALVERNTELIKASGAKTIVTACAECAATLRNLFPEFGGELGCDIKHLSELVSEAIDQGTVEFGDLPRAVTYHDPCRLGRHLGIYDEPRKAIEGANEIELKEMTHNRAASMCCGTSSWMSCDSASRMIQMERLREAKATGAETLLTACPKCQIHFKCTMMAETYPDEARIEVVDLASLIAEALRSRSKEKDTALEGVKSVG
jgi:Fe-S oxidoreductase